MSDQNPTTDGLPIIEPYENLCKHCGHVFEPEDEVRTTRDICDDCLQEYPDMKEIWEYD